MTLNKFVRQAGILVLLALTAVPAATTLLAQSRNNPAPEDELSLTSIFASGKYAQRGAGVMEPMKDGIHYYNNQRIGDSIPENALLIYAYQDGQVTDTLLKESWLRTPNYPEGLIWDDVELSPDETVLLLSTQTE